MSSSSSSTSSLPTSPPSTALSSNQTHPIIRRSPLHPSSGFTEHHPMPPLTFSAHQINNEALQNEATHRSYEAFSTVDWAHPLPSSSASSSSSSSSAAAAAAAASSASSSLSSPVVNFTTLPQKTLPRNKFWFFDVFQAWGSVMVVGMLVGGVVAWADVVFEWLSDLKLGRCGSFFYLSKKKCCWEQWDEEGSCPDWHEWSYEFLYIRYFPPVNFIIYVLLSVS